MKIITIVISLACFSHGVLANDRVILHQLQDEVDAMRTREEAAKNPDLLERDWDNIDRSGSLQRLKYIDRMRALQGAAKRNAEGRLRAEAARAEARAQAERRSVVAVQAAQAKAAARAQAQAQVQAAERARLEAESGVGLKKGSPPTSALMSRMGFSEKEIAAQKAREHSAKSGAKETTDATSQAGRQQEQSKPAVDSGAVGDHPAPSPAKP